MEENKYEGLYAVKILLTNTAWSNPELNKEIKSGNIEKILNESEGVKSYWKGASGCQNVAVMINSETAFALMNKLNELPYVHTLTLLKDGLLFREGYIPVED
jgi:hypothetical protein